MESPVTALPSIRTFNTCKIGQIVIEVSVSDLYFIFFPPFSEQKGTQAIAHVPLFFGFIRAQLQIERHCRIKNLIVSSG